jgi:hypothetical protein
MAIEASILLQPFSRRAGIFNAFSKFIIRKITPTGGRLLVCKIDGALDRTRLLNSVGKPKGSIGLDLQQDALPLRSLAVIAILGSIDPFQRARHGLGKTLIKRAGLSAFTEIIEEPHVLRCRRA